MTPKATFALYFHLPFCLKKCPYCDFNSYILDNPEELPRYLSALNAELEFYSAEPGWKDREIASIYFGGGTPTLLSARQIENILGAVTRHFVIREEAELTIEANPITAFDSLSANKFKELRSLGLNRISLGIQSFSDKKLKFLGRLHNVQEAKEAIFCVQDAGFENINLDLIFGTIEETLLDWESDLLTAINFKPQHISAYSLTIESGSVFYKEAIKGNLLSAKQEVMAELYRCAQQVLVEHGYLQYEISNFSKQGLACSHNLAYWTNKDYLGLGAGAHSYLKTKESEHGQRWSNFRSLEQYFASIGTKRQAQEVKETLTKEQARIEFFLLSLRQASGISKKKYIQNFKEAFDSRYQKAITCLEKEGLVRNGRETLALTSRGFLFADSVVAELVDC